MSASSLNVATRTRGLAVKPGTPDQLYLIDVPLRPPSPGEVVVRTMRVGICGTDREIIHGHLGTPPPDSDFLIIGHEVLGVVESVGEAVTRVAPGDLVTAIVRRPCDCPMCQSGQWDFCATGRYQERGIVGQHGFMSERFVEHERWLVPVPRELEPIGVLVEPLTIAEKAYRQALLIQRRIEAWQPRTALVFGAGPVGLLQTMLLRERGLNVWTAARSESPTAASQVVADCGAHYVSLKQTDIRDLAKDLPKLDLIVEATGHHEPVIAGMEILGVNGILGILSVSDPATVAPMPIGQFNRNFVMGNRLMVGAVNAAADDFRSAVSRLGRFNELWPGLADRLITRRLPRLEEALNLEHLSGGIKTVVEFS
jgi:threonine dehydrogenase-like Zn-dependent dehydrogenase